MITQISEEVLAFIREHLELQNEKGFEKYKETLDDVPFDNYNWNTMIIEEMTDALQYAVKENFRLKQMLKEHTEALDTKVFEKDVDRTFNNKLDGYAKLANGALGLTGEAGEVADIIKKFLYQGHQLNSDKIIDELGDVLYYLTLLAKSMGSSLDEVMTKNMMKRMNRYPAGFDKMRSVNRPENTVSSDYFKGLDSKCE